MVKETQIPESLETVLQDKNVSIPSRGSGKGDPATIVEGIGIPKKFQSPLGEVIKETSLTKPFSTTDSLLVFQSPLGEVVKETLKCSIFSEEKMFQSPLGEVVKETQQ